MVNQQTLQGNWNEIKGKLRSKWGQLTGDDLQATKGNVDELIGVIQRKTGEARSSIEKYLEQMTSDGASYVEQASETVREYANQAATSLNEASKQAATSVRYGYEQAERSIRQRPGEAAAICFGVGMLAGVVLGLALRSR
jgi:uncharacterized protein YjbJ (UPF0337 family)